MILKNTGSLTPSVALSLAIHILLVILVGVRYHFPHVPRLESYAVDLVYRLPALQVEAPRSEGGDTGEHTSVSETEPVPKDVSDEQAIVAEEQDDSKSDLVEKTKESSRMEVPPTAGVAEQFVSSAGVAPSRIEEPGYDYTLLLKELRRRISSSLVYPRTARRKGIEGTVVLLLKLDKDGSLANLSVRTSSGSDILDRSARELIKRVLPYRHGTGRTISVEIPIVYRLERR